MTYRFFIYNKQTNKPALEYQTDNWQSCKLDAIAYREDGYRGFILNTKTNQSTSFDEVV